MGDLVVKTVSNLSQIATTCQAGQTLYGPKTLQIRDYSKLAQPLRMPSAH